MSSVLQEARLEYHRNLCQDVLGLRGSATTNADSSSASSTQIATALARRIAQNAEVNLRELAASGQELGRRFTEYTARFLKKAFLSLEHARPGPWVFSTSQAEPGIARYEPYTHLAQLQALVDWLREDKPDVATSFGQDYLIMPDLVIVREPWPDTRLNVDQNDPIVGEGVAEYTPFRKRHPSQAYILHASVSCKWTLRSDRAQNARTEALNLIRNRKGRAPHIVVVTAEPMPTRLASIALGTGDIDCVYHVALPELRLALEETGREDQLDMFNQLVSGARLRDISDLPLDLAI